MHYNGPDAPEYVTFSKIIKAEELISKWPGCPENDLAYYARNNELACYLYSRTLKHPNGRFVHYCSPCGGPYNTGIGEDDCWEWNRIVFNLEDVEEFEKRHPEYLWQPVSLDESLAHTCDGKGGEQCNEINPKIASFISTDPEWMPAHEARVVIGMTPINFVNFLNTGILETDREQERLDFAKNGGWETDNVPFFKTADLDTLRVHKASFANYTSEIYVGRKIDTSILKYYFDFNKEHVGDDEAVGHNKNTQASDIIGTPEEWVGIDDARKMLQMTPKELLLLLDSGQIETTMEEERAFLYNDYINSPYTDREFFFFTKDKIGKFLVNKISVKRYAESNSISLIENKGYSTIDVNDEQVKARIVELERQLQELRQENKSLKVDGSEVVPPASDCENCSSIQDVKQRLAELETVNQNLQSRLDAASAPPHRWKPSCDALFQAFRQVVESSRDDWVQDEYLALAGRLYDNNGDKRGVLAEAGRLAWAALPDRFKAGPGNPKYKGNPTKE